MSWESIQDWFQNIDSYWVQLLGTVLITYLAIFCIKKCLRWILTPITMDEKRKGTIQTVVASVLRYVALIIILISAISPFVNVSKMLAGAGVLGVIIGFGAQSIIKDVLTGFFMIYERQIRHGDTVIVNGKYQGTIEEIGIRTLKIRDFNGKVIYTPNGNIKDIQNFNEKHMRINERVVVSYRNHPEKVFEALEEVCQKLNAEKEESLKKEENGEYVDKFRVFGITNLNHGYHGYEYGVTAVVKDEEYWGTLMEVRKTIAIVLHEKKIRMAEQNMRFVTEK